MGHIQLSEEMIYMSEVIASKLGAAAENAIATLLSSFCEPIWNMYDE